MQQKHIWQKKSAGLKVALCLMTTTLAIPCVTPAEAAGKAGNAVACESAIVGPKVVLNAYTAKSVAERSIMGETLAALEGATETELAAETTTAASETTTAAEEAKPEFDFADSIKSVVDEEVKKASDSMKAAAEAAADSKTEETSAEEVPAEETAASAQDSERISETAAETEGVEAVVENPEAETASDIYVANVSKYLSVFSEGSVKSDIVGRMYRGAACYVLDNKDGWSFISSGPVSGWVSDYYLVGGDEALTLSREINPRLATTTPDLLNVREEANTTSDLVAQVAKGSKLVVMGSTDEFWHVRVSGVADGYISKEFATVEDGYAMAISIKDEKAMQERVDKQEEVKAERQRKAEEKARTEEEAREAAAQAKAKQEREESKAEEEREEEIYSRQPYDEDDEEEEYEEEEEESGGWVSNGTFKTTAYCACYGCNGSNAGKTASGATPTVGTTVAVDRSVIPLGSKIKIGDHVYIAQDTGVHGNTIDIFHASHSEAMDYGVRYREVYIYRD